MFSPHDHRHGYDDALSRCDARWRAQVRPVDQLLPSKAGCEAMSPRHQSHFLSRKLQCKSLRPLLHKCCARCRGERGGTEYSSVGLETGYRQVGHACDTTHLWLAYCKSALLQYALKSVKNNKKTGSLQRATTVLVWPLPTSPASGPLRPPCLEPRMPFPAPLHQVHHPCF